MKPTIESFDIYTGVLKSISDRSFEGDWIKLEDFKKAIKLQEEADLSRFEELINESILDLSGCVNLELAEELFEEIRHIKFEKTEELFEVLNSHQLAVLFKLKKDLIK